MKVLIVDDSRIIRKAIESYISVYNLDIVGTAGNGEEALEIFKEKSPNIVTLDITMPKMDGLTCLKEMIKINSKARVMIISALNDEGILLEALKIGAHSFLNKPFTQEQLRENFVKIIESY